MPSFVKKMWLCESQYRLSGLWTHAVKFLKPSYSQSITSSSYVSSTSLFLKPKKKWVVYARTWCIVFQPSKISGNRPCVILSHLCMNMDIRDKEDSQWTIIKVQTHCRHVHARATHFNRLILRKKIQNWKGKYDFNWKSI